ncbi:hypothetical protein GMORB2_5361 [Geosmithia morbida]|uniref:Uncharacterized protein n=1 Tax=Geosmithia morbida TaxID=1094350 RepID=A0A9P4YXJ9_9HYPO|nr:uncharacterized protein GMORB2_5361 [Geosmithia morbida]KAF4124695.1 hypothetical protein GMORB2_5361 [Geosmithia morbida]
MRELGTVARSWLLAPGSWLLAPGSWLPAPGSRLLAPRCTATTNSASLVRRYRYYYRSGALRTDMPSGSGLGGA